MEYNDTINMEINKELIIKIVMIVLIIVAIFYQIKITKMIYDKEEMLNAEPLSYGARKYGIGECTCWLSDNVQIWFNKTVSITKITHRNTPTMDIRLLNLSQYIIPE